LKIIVGLGNPGKTYINNRHNIGFRVVDKIVEKENLKFKKSFKVKAMIAKASSGGEEILLAKPTTFMNNSGLSVKLLLSVYNLSRENFLIVYDDMDLPLGRMKFARRGSSAGHKGIASIIFALGNEEIPRLRIGISKPLWGEATDYVLSDFTFGELPVVEEVIEEAVQGCWEWAKFGINFVMQKYNVRKRGGNG